MSHPHSVTAVHQQIQNYQAITRRPLCSAEKGRLISAGFTVLELMVVIVITGILLSLLLPAVQRARATARLVTCKNQLRQIGIASHNYNDAYGQLPLTLWAPINLLPLMDQKPLWEKLQVFAGPVQIAHPRKRLKGDLPIWQCPEDGQAARGRYLISYPSNFGTLTPWETNSMDTIRLRNGMEAVLHFHDVTDGLSQTAYYSERLTMSDELSSDGRSTPKRFAWTVEPPVANVDDLVEKCTSPRLRQQDSGRFGDSSFYLSSPYDHISPPNTPQCRLVSNSALRTFTASSEHTGGVNLMLVDGSVRFVSESISLDIWRALGTRNGNETIGEF